MKIIDPNMKLRTPKSIRFSKEIPNPLAIQEMLSSHFRMEGMLTNIAELTKSLHDSPKSLLEKMTKWADEYLEYLDNEDFGTK